MMFDTLRNTKTAIRERQASAHASYVYLSRTVRSLLTNKKNIKVFGIGMPKTGTTTLGVVLNTLGFRHHTYDMDLTVQVRQGNFTEVYDRISKFDSFEDWPWFLIYKQLDQKYPNAKFILTTRKSTQAYINSLQKHHTREGVASSDFEKPAWWDGVFDFEPEDWNYSKAAQEYEEHNKEVKKYFKDRPGKLIELCWERGDTWKQICSFVNRKEPSVPFPHKNKST